jgi:hypothetical protein
MDCHLERPFRVGFIMTPPSYIVLLVPRARPSRDRVPHPGLGRVMRFHGRETERTRCLAPPRCLAPLPWRQHRLGTVSAADPVVVAVTESATETAVSEDTGASSPCRAATVSLLLTPHPLLLLIRNPTPTTGTTRYGAIPPLLLPLGPSRSRGGPRLLNGTASRSQPCPERRSSGAGRWQEKLSTCPYLSEGWVVPMDGRGGRLHSGLPTNAHPSPCSPPGDPGGLCSSWRLGPRPKIRGSRVIITRRARRPRTGLVRVWHAVGSPPAPRPTSAGRHLGSTA